MSERSRLGMVLPMVAVVVALVGFGVVWSQTRPAEPAVETTPLDLGEVPTERLESLLESFRDDPAFTDQIPGVSLVLAERHFTSGTYDRAFELYASVIEHPSTRPPQFAMSLSRVAWIAWMTTGDTLAALENLDQALRIDPVNAETRYIKGQVLWCGAGRTDEAVQLFDEVLRAPDLDDTVRAQVTGDLAAARAGEMCR